jgi:hypothetical protein
MSVINHDICTSQIRQNNTKPEFVLNANTEAERTGSDAEAALNATAALLSATLP